MTTLPKIDYLAIGHVCQDLTPDGPTLGGTVSYAALTAQALDMRVGILTSLPPDFALLDPLSNVVLECLPARAATTFENIYDADGSRRQILHARANDLNVDAVPQEWKTASIIHLAPLANEVAPQLVKQFPTALVGVTPQGWMRRWDSDGLVQSKDWTDAPEMLQAATVVVLSIEDVGSDEKVVEEFAKHAQILVVTRAEDGCSVHWRGKWQHIPAPSVTVDDPTGAGDIFAAAYFHRLLITNGDPHAAARFAVEIASASVTRAGLDSIPTKDEVMQAMSAAV